MTKERKTYSERTFIAEIMFKYRNNKIYNKKKMNERITLLTIRNIIIYVISIVLTMLEIKDIVENIETAYRSTMISINKLIFDIYILQLSMGGVLLHRIN